MFKFDRHWVQISAVASSIGCRPRSKMLTSEPYVFVSTTGICVMNVYQII